ncbi:MAG: STY4534 family ICE replication protein [Gammaproteobacteria bacterium]
MTTPCPSRSYFDLHVIGLGYLNRIREVKPKKGTPFLACDIAALTGPNDAPEYRRFDVRVTGSDAQQLIRRCAQAVSTQRKVLIGFRLGDLWTDLFTYTKGKNAGRPGVSHKARLLSHRRRSLIDLAGDRTSFSIPTTPLHHIATFRATPVTKLGNTFAKLTRLRTSFRYSISLPGSKYAPIFGKPPREKLAPAAIVSRVR